MHALQLRAERGADKATPEHPDNRTTLKQSQVQGNTGNGAGGETYHQEAPLPGHTAQGRLAELTTDRGDDVPTFNFGGDVESIRARCEEETHLPAPVKPTFQSAG